MPLAARSPELGLVLALVCFVGFVAIQRLFELWLSFRHARLLARQGGALVHEPRFVLIVLLHALFPVALAAEVLWLGARPAAHWPLWLLLFAAAQVLRYVAIRTLGVRWNVRIW